MSFREFDKIYRLGTQATEGILEGRCHIFPKLDGTNASVWDHEDILQCGSRRRHLSLTEQGDNAGFRAAMKEDKAVQLLSRDNPSWIIYGEWLVPHTIKGYKDDAWRIFYVFDVFERVSGRYLEPEEYIAEVDRCGVRYVPSILMYNPDMPDIEYAMNLLSKYLMKDGEVGEGIVIKNYSFVNKFGDRTYAKYIADNFNGRPKKVVYDNPIEEQIASLVTNDTAQKVAHKIQCAMSPGKQVIPEWDRGTMIPRLMETVYHEVIIEKLYDELKKLKEPTVDFKILRGLICKQVKLVAPELF